MERHAAGTKALLVLALLHIHIHHNFHGPPVDYLGLAAAAFASWSIIPGPGEPVLIAASIVAARQRLDISSVIIVAWLGASAGGMAGWLMGLRAGRALVTVRGPLHRTRLRALERGEAIFARHPLLAIYLTPSWVAGIHGVGTILYTTVNVLSAALWAAVIGLGAYVVGPPIVDVVGDLGTASFVALVVLVVSSVAAELVRRRRAHHRRSAAERDRR